MKNLKENDVVFSFFDDLFKVEECKFISLTPEMVTLEYKGKIRRKKQKNVFKTRKEALLSSYNKIKFNLCENGSNIKTIINVYEEMKETMPQYLI